MIRPNNTSKLAARLRNAFKGFHIVNVGNGGLNQMPPNHREEALRLLSRSYRAAREVKDKVEVMRQFTRPVTIATINGWGRHPGSPLKVFLAYDGGSFNVGRDPHSTRRVVVPEGYEYVLRDLHRFPMRL